MSQPSTPPLLSPAQRKLAAFAIGFASIAAIIVLLCVTVLVLGRLLSLFSGVLWPLATAGILALVLRPAVDWLEKRLKLSRLKAVILLFAVFILVVLGLLLTILPSLIGESIGLVQSFPGYVENASEYLKLHYPAWQTAIQHQLENPTVRSILDSITAELKAFAPAALPSLKAAGGGVLALFSFFTELSVVPVYLFFFLLSRAQPAERLADHLPFLKPGVREDVVFLAGEFVQLVVTFFRGQLLIGVLMGLLLATGFSIVGLKFGLLLGLLCGILNVVPYMGTAVGLLVCVPLAFFQPGGGWHLVGLVLLTKAIVQSIESWYLTPKIMGHSTGLHPAAIIFALFFWGAALDGLLGMILAIPLTAFVVTAWRLVKKKYFDAGTDTAHEVSEHHGSSDQATASKPSDRA